MSPGPTTRTPTRTPTRTRTRAVPLAVIITVAAALSGCAGGRISLGTGASVCFRALPIARDAVHNKGRLVGVRRVSADTLRARLPNNTVLATLPDQDLCVFAFRGTYDPGSVTDAQNTIPGPLAIVAVGDKHPVLVAASVVNQLPTRFRHLH